MQADKPHIVIVGGGVAALELAVGLHESRNITARVTLVAPDQVFHYRPLIVFEPFGIHQYMEMPIVDLLHGCDVELIHDRVTSVDLDFNRVVLSSGEGIEFDGLVVATGAFPTKSLDGALTISGKDAITGLERLIAEIDADVIHSVAFTLPGGASWELPAFELALLAKARGRARTNRDLHVSVVTSELRPLQPFGQPAGDAVTKKLREADIALYTNERAVSFGDGIITTASGATIEADRAVSIPQLSGHPIDGLPHDDQGFLPIDEHCAVFGAKDVWAAGDISNFKVKLGAIAAQHADAIIDALAVRFGSQEEADPFEPRLHAILFSDSGETYLRAAAGDKAALTSEQPLWDHSEKIFSRHLSVRMQRLRASQARDH
jgi:sulfide:quinone oxidoreductase